MTNEELVLKYQEGNNKALEELIEQNRGIINKLVNKYNIDYSELDREDLVQSGILGLITAAKKYDFYNSKKAKFITYAVQYINRFITNSLFGHSDTERNNNELNRKCTSLNSPLSEDGETKLQEVIESVDYGFENIEDKILLRQLRSDLEELMRDNITLYQREVIKLIYGWDSEEMSYDEIAEIFNQDKQDIKHTKISVLNKLRNSSWIKENRLRFMEEGLINYPRLCI